MNIMWRISLLKARAGYWWRNLFRQIDQRLPYICDCGHVAQQRHVIWETTTWGERVSFCPRCWEELL